MSFIFINTTIKDVVKRVLMSLALSSIALSVQAMVTPANAVEMGLALATIPSDILAHHYDLTDKKKSAALCHLVTDAISIVQKGTFFYNNVQVPMADRACGVVQNKDLCINAAWLARDVTRFYQHLKKYRTAKNAVVTPADQIVAAVESDPVFAGDDLFVALGEVVETELNPEEISRLAYLCQVVLIPSLRGMSACALGWSQGSGAIDEFNGKQARFLASALHSLIRLSEEYSELEVDSPYKKVLGAALIANVVLLAKEISDFKVAHQEYKIEQERREQLLRRLNLRLGQLPVGALDQQQQIMQRIRQLRGEDAQVFVGDEEQAFWQDMDAIVDLNEDQPAFARQLQRGNPQGRIPVLAGINLPDCTSCLAEPANRRLACGHAFCLDCLGGQVNTAIGERQAHVNCLDRDCRHDIQGVGGDPVNVPRPMDDADVRAIIQAVNPADQAVMNRYDQLWQRGQQGARICPAEGCTHVFGNPNNRRIIGYRCPVAECDQQYCSHCTVPHARNISCMRARIEADCDTRAWLDESENRTLCPGCFTRCERANACPNMVCSEARCGKAFCLYCHQIGGAHVPNCPQRWFNDTPDGMRQNARN